MEKGDQEGKSLLDAMMDGELDGMQYFDGELEKLVRNGSISVSTALLYATNAGNLKVALADVPDEDSLITR
jgi:twitching motility protein PilT